MAEDTLQASESNSQNFASPEMTTPPQIAAALQRQHPEWVSEIVEALGETTIVVPREQISVVGRPAEASDADSATASVKIRLE